MEPPRWARDHLGRLQIVFAHQNQGHTMVIRLVFGLDPSVGPESAFGAQGQPGKPYGKLIEAL
jgi:hypothetical protein